MLGVDLDSILLANFALSLYLRVTLSEVLHHPVIVTFAVSWVCLLAYNTGVTTFHASILFCCTVRMRFYGLRLLKIVHLILHHTTQYLLAILVFHCAIRCREDGSSLQRLIQLGS